MPWVRLDDGFADHPKIEEVGPFGLAVNIRAICWANKHLTDGRIPKSKAQKFAVDAGKEKTIQALLDSGLWVEKDGAYWIHDFLDYNPSKAEKDEKRRATVQRVRRHREKSNGVVTQSVTALQSSYPPRARVPEPDPDSKEYPHTPVDFADDDAFAERVQEIRSAWSRAFQAERGTGPGQPMDKWIAEMLAEGTASVDVLEQAFRLYLRGNDSRKLGALEFKNQAEVWIDEARKAVKKAAPAPERTPEQHALIVAVYRLLRDSIAWPEDGRHSLPDTDAGRIAAGVMSEHKNFDAWVRHHGRDRQGFDDWGPTIGDYMTRKRLLP